jgi:aminopeptidase N
MRRAIAFGLVVGLLACGTDDDPGNPGDPGDPDDPGDVEQAPNPEPAGPRGYNAVAYALVGSFDWTRRQLTARETITLDVAAGTPMIVLDTRVEVAAVKTTRGVALPFEHDRVGGLLKVELGGSRAAAGRVAFVVEYRAGTSSALLAADGRDDDPVGSRMVFTDSEPDRSREWMVVNDHPSDRAIWTVELSVAADEDVVANGVRTSDRMVDGARVVRYRIEQRIPTYLMAFAAGQIDHADRITGRVPISVWYRRGLLVDTDAHLELLADLMTRFEALLGPYPWPSYGVVLVPYPFAFGGMENATISFNGEASGQGNIGRQLNAHEFAHQWFGDWVTMADYEHVWFKEGMATVLGSEGDRGIRDSGIVPRLFGLDFSFRTGEAIVDRGLYGIARYTTGPYQRAAWLITQIRARIGDEAFWDRLRATLDANALGTLTGERFLQGFAPALGAAEIQQLIATLELKTTPTISAAVAVDGSNRNLTIALSDPQHQLLVPLGLTVVDAAGNATRTEVPAGESRVVSVPADGYLAPDEAELSARWSSTYNLDPAVFGGQLVSLFVPSVQAGRNVFGSRSTAQQELALGSFGLPPFEAAAFPGFYADLDSTVARRNAEIAVCRNAANEQTRDAWRPQIANFIDSPGIESFSILLAGCPAPQAAVDELARLAAAPTAATARRLSYLMSFDYSPEVSLAQIGKVAATAPSLQLREQALSRLAAQLIDTPDYSPVVDDAPWRALFRAQLASAETSARFNIVWNASLRAPTDLGALPIVASRLHIYALSDLARRTVVCDAHGVGDVAWESFRSALHREALSPTVLEVIDDPARCATSVRALVAQPEAVQSKPL